MLLVDDVDNKEYLTDLFHVIYDELPLSKTKRKNYKVPLQQKANRQVRKNR